MKINAVAVTSSDLKNSAKFYTLLGFEFPEFNEDEQHLEPLTPNGSARLMIDSKKLISEILGEAPHPGNHSAFAIQYKSAEEIDAIVANIKQAGFKTVKQPWKAFWGQYYAILEDPDGYKVDLYANL